jgi:hypothetical protein
VQVSALQVKEEERVATILGDGNVPRFGYDEIQQQRLVDIDRELLKIATPDVADELIASFGKDSVLFDKDSLSTPTSRASGVKSRADAEANRFLQYEQQRRQEQARIKELNAQLRSIMELERLSLDADASPPELPPGCRLVPKSRDSCAPLVVVAAPSAIQSLLFTLCLRWHGCDIRTQELLLDIQRAESLGNPSAWAAASFMRGSSRPDSACSALSAATAGSLPLLLRLFALRSQHRIGRAPCQQE